MVFTRREAQPGEQGIVDDEPVSQQSMVVVARERG